jgi:single-strand DNA-binding protein
MMNQVSLIGRLTKDPELHKTGEGRSICKFTLALEDNFSKEDRADFICVTVFGNQGENCIRYLHKGILAGIEGRIHSEANTDSDGVKRYSATVIASRVIFLEWPEKPTAQNEAAA